MSEQTRVAAERTDAQPTVGALVHQLAEEIPHLVRSEIRLAQAEVTEKGKRVGVGIGMFSAAGLLVFLGIATLVATAVLGLAEALPAWLSALIVAAVLLLVAGALALLGKSKVRDGQPLKPERAIAGVQADVATLKEVRR
jgi:uncharacterized membrane protein YqjE